MYIYKLKFTDKQEAELTLLALGVYIETEEGISYGEGIQAVVEIGLIVLENGTYDEQGNVINEPTYADGYHYDVMSMQNINFGSDEIFPLDCVHSFAGYPKNADGKINNIEQ